MEACRKIISCCTLVFAVWFSLILEFGDGQPGDEYDAAGRAITYTLDDPGRAIAIGQRHGFPPGSLFWTRSAFKIFGMRKIFFEGSRRVSRWSE
jgi:hypothetical protein